MSAKFIVKEYRIGWWRVSNREKYERWLLSQGYHVYQEEDVFKWSIGALIVLLIVCFPLCFLAREKKIKVTYELQ